MVRSVVGEWPNAIQMKARVVAGLSVALLLAITQSTSAAASGTWTPTGSLPMPLDRHTATLLPSGKVLVAGGSASAGTQATAEIYDAQSGIWNATGSMTTSRTGHTATLLPSGKVLVAAGLGTIFSTLLASAELYDPLTATWVNTGSLAMARLSHTASLLQSGKVLVAGGYGSGATVTAATESYDSLTGTWTSTGNMTTARVGHTSTLLPNGRVLIAGGCGGSSCTTYHSSAEIFDPLAGSWSATGSMAVARYGATATLLPSGKVLVAGGNSATASWASAELYDPLSGTWAATGSMASSRTYHTATLTSNGQVLIAGGESTSYPAPAELYDPTSGSWTAAGTMSTARSGHTATALLSGKVLVAGGYDGHQRLASAELYTSGILIDSTPPVITVPTTITVNAATPGGAVVTYVATATDNVSVVAFACAPPSGSSFVIGETMVTCTAADAAGNTAKASFTVRVLGADAQIGALRAAIRGIGLPFGTATSFSSKLDAARAALSRGDTPTACRQLAAVIQHADAQSGKKQLSIAQADQIIADATRIRSVLGCRPSHEDGDNDDREEETAER